MVKTKVLKIKVGDVFIDGKNYPVFENAWKKTSKDGKTTYYERRNVIFVSEVETDKIKEENLQADA